MLTITCSRHVVSVTRNLCFGTLAPFPTARKSEEEMQTQDLARYRGLEQRDRRLSLSAGLSSARAFQLGMEFVILLVTRKNDVAHIYNSIFGV